MSAYAAGPVRAMLCHPGQEVTEAEILARIVWEGDMARLAKESWAHRGHVRALAAYVAMWRALPSRTV